MNGSYFGMMAYRKGRKWGISCFYYVPIGDCVAKDEIVPCRCSSMEEALKQLPSWKNPFGINPKRSEKPAIDDYFPKIDGWDYRKINKEVMTDTKQQYETMPALRSAIAYSIAHQFMVEQEDNIDQPVVKNGQTQYITSGKRSFEAAKAYKGKKTAVLNFANNHAIGGAPFSAGAQEESLCRCSTLLPCLEAMRMPFYQKHIDAYTSGVIGPMGNDDLIYTPDVVVFKTDERTDPNIPQMMAQIDWYKVDVITCSAPELMKMRHIPKNYEDVIMSRVKKILDVAAKEEVEVLILGAWGCGAFKNDPHIVSKAFFTLLKNYNFEVVEFALATHGDISNSPFAKN